VATKLLLIDDDVSSCQMLQMALTQEGFQVALAHDAASGLHKAYTFSPDVVILDVSLPDKDGWQVCRCLHETLDVPILVLTALSSQEDIVKGLDLGADDYVIKPVGPDELTARIRALLRRVDGFHGNEVSQHEPDVIQGNVVVYFDKCQVFVGGKRVHLTSTELHLLSVLVQHRGCVVSHASLLTQVWGPEHASELRLLRLYINYLRRKLERNPSKPSLIRSEWGVGYRFG
jgi:DNA-binding response OmpR family regulator